MCKKSPFVFFICLLWSASFFLKKDAKEQGVLDLNKPVDIDHIHK